MTSTRTRSIFIDKKTGSVKALHSNLVDKLIPHLGIANVERVSSIEYDNGLQTWKALIGFDGKEFFSDIREEVLELEAQYINDLIRRGKI